MYEGLTILGDSKSSFFLKQVFIKSKFRTRGLTPKMPFEVFFSPCNIEKVSQSFSYIAFVFALLNFFDASANSQLKCIALETFFRPKFYYCLKFGKKISF